MKFKNIFAAAVICILFCGVNVKADNTNVGLVATYEVNQLDRSNIRYIDAKSNVAQDKKWTVKFNRELDASTATSENIQVLDSDGQTVAITISVNDDNMSVDILPPTSKYSAEKTYTICIKKSLLSKDKCELSKEIRMSFTIIKDVEDNTDTDTDADPDPDLVEAVAKMDAIKAEVKTQPEKDLVSSIKSVMEEKVNNPSKTVDTSSVKSKYNNLSNSEKSDFQSILLNNFSLSTLIKIKSLFS